MTMLLALGSISQVGRAQQVVSAQSGTIHYSEGTVTVDGSPLEVRKSHFANLRPGQELRTEDGRVEMLLTPGAFLRVSDHSAVRMLDNSLTDTRIEVVNGSVVAECDALLKDNAITLTYSGNTIRLIKHGLYRIDTAPARLRVFEGEAMVESASSSLMLKHGRETALDSGLVAEKFSRKATDTFDIWDANRSALLASASAGASQSMLNSNTSWSSSGWYLNPYYGLYTYVPLGGVVYSPFGWYDPFGWQFWSPSAMSVYYVPTRGATGGASSGAPAPISSAPGGSTVSSGPGTATSGGTASNGGISQGGGTHHGFGGMAPVAGGGRVSMGNMGSHR